MNKYDYFCTYTAKMPHVQQGHYTIEQLLDYAIESKMKTAYLLTEAMPYLATAESTSNQDMHNYLVAELL